MDGGSDDARLPAKVEVSGLIRSVQAAGGFATVLAKGEPEAGTLLIVTLEKGGVSRAFERMPQADGTRAWACAKHADSQETADFDQWVARRRAQDPDLWIVELDVAEPERFIAP